MSGKKKILLLGGEGFIGRNLSDYLSGFFDCVSVGVEESLFGGERKDRFLKTNPYEERLEDEHDVVVHLIDNKTETSKFADEEEKLAKNTGLNEKKHLIVFSSAVVYANPSSEYGQRKIALEKFYRDYCRKNKTKLAILRLFNIYGPYQLPNRQGSLVANILFNHLNNKATSINDRSAERDFIYSSDMAKAVKRVIDSGFEGLDDLATEKMTSIEELIEMIEKDIIKEKLSITDNDIKEEISSPKAKSEIIKDIELTSFKEGMLETFEFYKNNLSKINKYGI